MTHLARVNISYIKTSDEIEIKIAKYFIEKWCVTVTIKI